jgi:hypothetical protein
MKVLFLSYYFPPFGGAGVQRALKFVKYLPLFSVQPIVIAADDPDELMDPSLMEDTPLDVPAYRVKHRSLTSRLLSFYGTLVRGYSKKHKTVAKPKCADVRDVEPPVWRDRVLRLWGSMFYPDDKSSWGRKAYHLASKILSNERIDLIFSTSPPITAHVVARRLKGNFNIPWVADFRDLWTGNPAYQMPRWRRALDRRLERQLLQSADGLVGVTETITSTLRKDAANPQKTICITNGYDEEDFSGLAEPGENRHPGVFVFLYLGSLYGHQSPEHLLRGLDLLIAENPELTKAMRFRFLGNIGTRFQSLLLYYQSKYPGVIEVVPYMPHLLAIRELMNADGLLLIIGGGEANKGVLTGKIFEYLRANKPILLLGPTDGEAAQLVERCGAGIAVQAHDISRIAQALRDLMCGKVKTKGGDWVKQFERQALTKRLAEFLNECAGTTHIETPLSV